PRVRARVGEAAEGVVVPAALEEQRPPELRDRHARAARRDLLHQRARVVAGRAAGRAGGVGDREPRALEDRRELAVQEVNVGDRAGRQALGATDVVVDVEVVSAFFVDAPAHSDARSDGGRCSAKPSCRTRSASSAYLRATTHEILISDVEISWMLM